MVFSPSTCFFIIFFFQQCINTSNGVAYREISSTPRLMANETSLMPAQQHAALLPPPQKICRTSGLRHHFVAPLPRSDERNNVLIVFHPRDNEFFLAQKQGGSKRRNNTNAHFLLQSPIKMLVRNATIGKINVKLGNSLTPSILQKLLPSTLH